MKIDVSKNLMFPKRCSQAEQSYISCAKQCTLSCLNMLNNVEVTFRRAIFFRAFFKEHATCTKDIIFFFLGPGSFKFVAKKLAVRVEYHIRFH